MDTVPESMQVCTFGCLEPIFLPPTAVSIPRTQISQVNFIGVKTKESNIHNLYRSVGVEICTKINCRFDIPKVEKGTASWHRGSQKFQGVLNNFCVSSIEGHLPSKIFFHWRLSSIWQVFLSQIFFCCRMSFCQFTSPMGPTLLQSDILLADP